MALTRRCLPPCRECAQQDAICSIVDAIDSLGPHFPAQRKKLEEVKDELEEWEPARLK